MSEVYLDRVVVNKLQKEKIKKEKTNSSQIPFTNPQSSTLVKHSNPAQYLRLKIKHC